MDQKDREKAKAEIASVQSDSTKRDAVANQLGVTPDSLISAIEKIGSDPAQLRMHYQGRWP